MTIEEELSKANWEDSKTKDKKIESLIAQTQQLSSKNDRLTADVRSLELRLAELAAQLATHVEQS